MLRYLFVGCKDLCLEWSFWIPMISTLPLFSSLHVSHIFTWNIHTWEYENTICLPHHRGLAVIDLEMQGQSSLSKLIISQKVGLLCGLFKLESSPQGTLITFSHTKFHIYHTSFSSISPFMKCLHEVWSHVLHFWFVKHAPIMTSIDNHSIRRITFGTPKLTTRKSCHILMGILSMMILLVLVNNNMLQGVCVCVSIQYLIPSIFV